LAGRRELISASRRERELASDERVGRWSRSEIRQQQLDYLRKVRWPVAAGVLAFCVLMLPTFFLVPEPLRWILLGAVLSSGGWFAYMTVLLGSGTAPLVMGDQAESIVAEELRQLRRRGWRVINGLVLTHGDIDHVAVGPGGVLVVETKWRAKEWDITDETDVDLLKAIHQVKRNAANVDRWLALQVGRGRALAVVVPCGPRVSGEAGDPVRVVDGVSIVPRRDFRDWLGALPDEGVRPDAIDAAFLKIDAHVGQRDASERNSDPVPPERFQRVYNRWLFSLTIAFVAFVGNVLAVVHLKLVGGLIAVFAAAAAVVAGRRTPAVARYSNAWLIGTVAAIAEIAATLIKLLIG
jgi:hypothetical protein